jgi:LmbE family N-acetylglucosaminyl deacetylase
MNILVVAAHPDDEVLGCGGTIAQHTAAEDEVQVIFMAAGRDDTKSRTMALDAANVMKTRTPLFLGHKDQLLDTYPLLKLTYSASRWQALRNGERGPSLPTTSWIYPTIQRHYFRPYNVTKKRCVPFPTPVPM